MSDKIRRFVCRLLFFVFCVVPTLLVLQWILTPPNTIQWENDLQRTLGLRTQVEFIKTPLPNQTVLSQLLIDNVHGEPMDFGMVTVTNRENTKKIWLQSLELQADSLRDVLTTIYEHLDSRDFVARKHQLFLAAPLTIKETDAIVTGKFQQLHDVSIQLIPSAATLTVQVEFRLGKSDDFQPVSCQFTRRRDQAAAGAQVSETWNLDCGSEQVPVWLLATIYPDLNWLGANAVFSGAARLSLQNGKWSGSLQGSLERVNLQRLIGQALGHRIDGLSHLTLSSCRFQQGKLTELEGTFHAAQGLVGTELLRSIDHHLPLACPILQQLQDEQLDLEYADWNFGFALRNGLIEFSGDALGRVGKISGLDTPLFELTDPAGVPVNYLLYALGSVEPSYVPLRLRELSAYLQFPGN